MQNLAIIDIDDLFVKNDRFESALKPSLSKKLSEIKKDLTKLDGLPLTKETIHYMRRMTEHAEINPGGVEALDYFDQNGFPVLMLSNNPSYYFPNNKKILNQKINNGREYHIESAMIVDYENDLPVIRKLNKVDIARPYCEKSDNIVAILDDENDLELALYLKQLFSNQEKDVLIVKGNGKDLNSYEGVADVYINSIEELPKKVPLYQNPETKTDFTSFQLPLSPSVPSSFLLYG